MRIIFVAAAFALLASSAAFSQTSGSNTAAQPAAASPSTGVAGTPPLGGPPEEGGPLLPATDAGWDRVAPMASLQKQFGPSHAAQPLTRLTARLPA